MARKVRPRRRKWKGRRAKACRRQTFCSARCRQGGNTTPKDSNTQVNLERLLLLVAVAAAAALPAGCAPEAYQRSADAEVYKLLAKRKKGVLDYQPETAVVATPGLAAPRRAYEKIPVTPVPPLAPPPVKQPEPVEVPYGPLGPEARWIGQPVP